MALDSRLTSTILVRACFSGKVGWGGNLRNAPFERLKTLQLYKVGHVSVDWSGEELT